MTDTAPILRMHGLSKLYGSHAALDDVSLDVTRGEFVTLLGPSGSGKTTLLNIISGAILPSSGTLWLDGRDITQLPARHRGIGMVFQNFALMPHLSIFENIAFPLRVRKLPKDEIKDRVAQALALIRLPDVADRKPKQLSGGQQQRVAIARALVYRPPVILMDEPLGALDRKLRQQMQFEIKRIHDELGLTMIYVTHDQEEALTMSDRICLMGGGKIRDVGTPQRIYANPASAFSADFFGATNIFKGVVSKSQDAVAIAHDDLGVIRTSADVAHDGEVSWMVRPEQLHFLKSHEQDDNVVEGIIDDVILCGQITQYIVAVGEASKITVACLTSSAAGGPSEKSRVRVGWPKHATTVLRSER